MWNIQKIAIYFFYFYQPEKTEVAERFDALDRVQLFPSYCIYLLLLAIAILAWVKYRFPQAINVLFSFFLRLDMRTTYNEDVQPFLKSFWWLLLIYSITSGALVYCVLIYFESNYYGLILIPLFYYLFLVIVLRSFQYFLEIKKGGVQQVLLLQQTFLIVGISFLPLLTVLLLNVNWAREVFLIALLVVTILLTYRLVKGFRFGIQNNMPWYYLILYFCTLEIWPLLVIYDYFL